MHALACRLPLASIYRRYLFYIFYQSHMHGPSSLLQGFRFLNNLNWNYYRDSTWWNRARFQFSANHVNCIRSNEILTRIEIIPFEIGYGWYDLLNLISIAFCCNFGAKIRKLCKSNFRHCVIKLREKCITRFAYNLYILCGWFLKLMFFKFFLENWFSVYLKNCAGMFFCYNHFLNFTCDVSFMPVLSNLIHLWTRNFLSRMLYFLKQISSCI